jgi:pyruvate/2-oxoglutarate/acetoin dehydrogenase E1 component
VDGIVASVRKTHRVVVVGEDCRTAGSTAEIAAAVGEQAFEYLDAPVGRVAAKDTFIAHNLGMSEYVLPSAADIEEAVWNAINWS